MTDLPLADRLAVMALTDPGAAIGCLDAALEALRGGVPALQLRWKDGPPRQILDLAVALRKATRETGSLLIINDRVDIALAAEADGAHLGDDDLPLSAARQIVPDGFILGKSVDTPEEATAAALEGADYVGLGPVYTTSSKQNLGKAIGPEGVEAVRKAVRVPIVAIGGIGIGRAAAVVRAGADGVAVIAAIMNSADPQIAAKTLVDEVRMERTAK